MILGTEESGTLCTAPCEDNCYAYCLAEELSIKALQKKWKEMQMENARRRAQAIAAAVAAGNTARISSPSFGSSDPPDKVEMQVIPLYKDEVALMKIGRKDCFVFSFGCLVCWGCNVEEAESAKSAVQEVLIKRLPPQDVDEDSIPLGSRSSPIAGFDAKTMDRVAVAYALAQSVRLGYLELRIDRSIAQTRRLPEELASKGHVTLSSRQVAMMIGELCVLRNQVNLQADLLDLPDFFWQWEAFEPLYMRCRQYLDMEKRVSILNTRFEVLQDMFDVLEGEQNERQATRLEWVIIVLCAVEAMVMALRIYTRVVNNVTRQDAKGSGADHSLAVLPILGPLGWLFGMLKQFVSWALSAHQHAS